MRKGERERCLKQGDREVKGQIGKEEGKEKGYKAMKVVKAVVTRLCISFVPRPSVTILAQAANSLSV